MSMHFVTISYLVVFLISVMLGACGTEGGSKSTAANSSKQFSENKTYYLESRSDLKECDESTLNYLVYLKDEAVFLGCDGTDWAEIEIKAKETVVETRVETKEVMVQYDDPLIFTDSYTGLSWHRVGSKTNYPYELANGVYVSVCEVKGMRMPDRAELSPAITNGLWLNLEESDMFTTRIGDTGTGDLKFQTMNALGNATDYGYMSLNGNGANDYTSGSHGIFCISE